MTNERPGDELSSEGKSVVLEHELVAPKMNQQSSRRARGHEDYSTAINILFLILGWWAYAYTHTWEEVEEKE